MPVWTTKRTSLRSMPIPNATVATTTSTSSLEKASWLAWRSSADIPAW